MFTVRARVPVLAMASAPSRIFPFVQFRVRCDALRDGTPKPARETRMPTHHSGRGAGVGRGRGVTPDLGVGVGLGVVVGVPVGVSVALGVGVGLPFASVKAYTLLSAQK